MRTFLLLMAALTMPALVTMANAAQITFMRGTNQIWDYPSYDGSVPVIEKPANNNWVSPVNYANGAMYMRYEVLEKPSTMTVGVQLCFWMPGWSPETCSNQLASSIPRVYYYKFNAPATWWHNGTYPWSANNYYKARLFHKAGTGGTLLAVTSCGNYCYQGDITQHVPIKFNVEIIAVSSGATFQPPTSWTGNPWQPVDDKTPPLITAVTCSDANKVNVAFNEALNAASAQAKANYVIDQSITVNSAVLSGNTVTLTTSALTPDVTYTLTVSNVKDASDNTIAANTTKTFKYVPFSGWLEDFNDGQANGWTTGEGTWSVSGGKYENSNSGRTSSWYGGQSFDDITYTADVTPSSATDVWLIFRVQDAGNYYLFTLGNSGKGAIYKLSGGNYTKLADGTGSFATGTTYNMKVELAGSSIKVYANNTLVASATDASYSSGYVGFGSNSSLGQFDNATVPSTTGLAFPGTPGNVAPYQVGLFAQPNPFSDGTQVSFRVPFDHSDVRLQVTDLAGKPVASLMRTYQDHGQLNIRWDGLDDQERAVPGGIYLIKLSIDNQTFFHKIIINN